ncbi:MAG: zinc ABC transporter substrate-binding protein [Phycisphaerae bacterium]|nr:zinc ABC transporter substrate-binding protein [Phycisphaerae bacterium]
MIRPQGLLRWFPGAFLVHAVVISMGAGAAPADPYPVFVSIPPQKFFVERIGGDLVRVGVLLPPGQSPHTYEPTPKLITELGRAKIYFRIGVNFEDRVLQKVASTFPDLEIVDTRRGIDLAEQEHECDHEGDHDHDHGELDPHIWLSPRLAKIQARTIFEALAAAMPEHRDALSRNLDAFLKDLGEVDARIAAELAPLKGKDFLVYHPAYGYFAQAYGLHQIAIESGGKQPTAKALAELIQRAKSAGVKLIFVQPQFGKRNAEAVAEAIGGAVIEVDPLSGDYLNNLRHIADAVREALGGGDRAAGHP